MLSIQNILVSSTPSINHAEECVLSLPGGNSPFGQVQLHGVMCGFKLSEAEPTALGVSWDAERCPDLEAGGSHSRECFSQGLP